MNVEQDQADTSPVIREEDNLVLFATPQREANDSGPWFIAALAADERQKGEITDMAATLPPLWQGRYVGHFHPVVGTKLAEYFVPGFFAEKGFTHLAYLETNQGKEGDPVFFNGEAVTHTGLICWFNETTQKFYFIHCRACAFQLLRWMTAMQEEWANITTASSSPPTLN